MLSDPLFVFCPCSSIKTTTLIVSQRINKGTQSKHKIYTTTSKEGQLQYFDMVYYLDICLLEISFNHVSKELKSFCHKITFIICLNFIFDTERPKSIWFVSWCILTLEILSSWCSSLWSTLKFWIIIMSNLEIH